MGWLVAITILNLLVAPGELWAADFSGSVVSVLDGDTLEVLHNNRAERIRLSGIDCPEKGQAYGNNAKHAASDLAFGKDVTIQTHGYDKYTRTLGDVILPDVRDAVDRSANRVFGAVPDGTIPTATGAGPGRTRRQGATVAHGGAGALGARIGAGAREDRRAQVP